MGSPLVLRLLIRLFIFQEQSLSIVSPLVWIISVEAWLYQILMIAH